LHSRNIRKVVFEKNVFYADNDWKIPFINKKCFNFVSIETAPCPRTGAMQRGGKEEYFLFIKGIFQSLSVQ